MTAFESSWGGTIVSGKVVSYFSHLILGLKYRSLAGANFSPAHSNGLAIQQIAHPRTRCPLSYTPDTLLSPFCRYAIRGPAQRAILRHFAALARPDFTFALCCAHSASFTRAALGSAARLELTDNFCQFILVREKMRRLASPSLPAKRPKIWSPSWRAAEAPPCSLRLSVNLWGPHGGFGAFVAPVQRCIGPLAGMDQNGPAAVLLAGGRWVACPRVGGAYGHRGGSARMLGCEHGAFYWSKHKAW